MSTSDVKKEETTEKEPQIDVPKTDIKAEKNLKIPQKKNNFFLNAQYSLR